MIHPLIRGECPICKKQIMNDNRTVYINGGMDFWVRFSDGSNAMFSICEGCYRNITQDQLDSIIASQKINWGIEIAAQLKWFYEKACHLKIISHARMKNEL